MDIISTTTLLGVKKQLPKFQALFMTKYFPYTAMFSTKAVALDKLKKKVKRAPLVSPKVAGKINQKAGRQLLSLEPAYVKPTDEVDPEELTHRLAGEDFEGSSNPESRRNALISELLVDQEDSIVHLEEWMCVEAICRGGVTLEGDSYPTTYVDYHRDPANSVALVGAAKWVNQDIATYDPTEDIEQWASKSAGLVSEVTMDPVAWGIFRKFKAVKEKLDTRRGSESKMEMGPTLQKVVQYKGSFGEFEIFVYAGKYTDSDDVDHY